MAPYITRLRTFRDSLEAMAPAWLKGTVGLRYLFGHSIHLDAFGDALLSGVQTRFPGYYSDASLPLIGKERRILRGLKESNTNYAARLITWLIEHAHRGQARAMLAQLYLHYYPDNFPMMLIARNGLTHTMAPDGTITRSVIAWQPDSPADPARWARWWLIFRTDRWSANPTPDEIADIIAIPSAWNAAHAQGHMMIMPVGAEFWNSFDPETWSSAGTWSAARGPIIIPLTR